MSELLPTLQAETVRASLLDYLTTTFALTDEDARTALVEFLSDSENGLFKGPYVRLRLPFRTADPGWRDTLGWYEGHDPYGHQAAAFARLTSIDVGLDKPRPLPTMVTTGTGSGKTEAFLHPILDHVLRVQRAGVTGTKALVLYPMNALANDQAKRLTGLLMKHPALAGITAALYTGQEGKARTRVTTEGLITDRAVIRSDPPDILLTNYKMLDQLLLRHEDAHLWAASAHSLQYLVLDEFHTYDGAQGTDVSMLLRRLGAALKSHWSEGDPRVDALDWERPLGRITPVATSATLGGGGDPAAMLAFAETVFGEAFPRESVIGESRQNVAEWIGDAPETVHARGLDAVELDEAQLERLDLATRHLPAEAAAVAAAVLDVLYDRPATADSVDQQLDLLRAHPVTSRLLTAATEAADVRDLAEVVLGGTPGTDDSPLARERRERCLVALIAAFSHLRAITGRQAPSVDLHLWVRELTRIDRRASGNPLYSWSDDGEVDAGDPTEVDAGDNGPPLPALYCRHCGRSGWGVVLAPTGTDLDTDDESVRRRRFARDERFRPLIYAPSEGDRATVAETTEQHENLMWFAVRQRRLLAELPDDDEAVRTGQVLPVLTHRGQDAGERSVDDSCPACQQKDGLRFLGAAIATLLSVTLSTIFGDDQLDAREKKALIFTDSVQDAAHRAGFVQSRSYHLTLRAVLREAVGAHHTSLDALVDQVIALAGDDPQRRYRVVPPELVDREEFAPFWQAERLRDVPPRVRTRVKKRLLLDAVLEFGLQSRTGRTLERTGSVSAEVSAGAATLLRAADHVIDEAGGLPTIPGLHGSETPDAQASGRTAWVRGVLERMRERGAIAHPWFERYQREDGNRYSIWGGRRRDEGMPAFPKGRPAPGYPRIGGDRLAKDTDLDAVSTPQSWYSQWTRRCLDVTAADGAVLARALFVRLAQVGVLDAVASDSGAQVYRLPESSVVVSPVSLSDLEAGLHALTCGVCHAETPTSLAVNEQLDGAPCVVARCPGRLTRRPRVENFYRRMYDSTDIRRVVAREHTSMLDDETRLAYEEAFKNELREPQAPNVLVATPTLEMGIDIGDLSTVMLASLPRSVASYLQRVGRAGRLTGNSLNLAFVTGRGDQLPRLGDPLSVVNGEVRPPATYLDAEEILRRQFVAFVADRLARDPAAPHPRTARDAIGTTDPSSYLHTLLTEAETHRERHLRAFLDGFPTLGEAARASLTRWVTPVDEAPGTSALAVRLHERAHRWALAVETLEFRRQAISAALPDLQQIANTPAATDDDKRAVRTASASLRLTLAQLAELRGEYWIGVLEEQGLFPTYTLIDDGVTLDVTLSWTDPDTGNFESEPLSYHRGGSRALTEFAPGASFYAAGHRLVVDAVDVGHDASAVTTQTFCPACGYVTPVGEPAAVTSCPRCGSKAIADTRQRLQTLELDRVYSAMRREDAAITDDSDERTRETFTVVVAADVDPGKVDRRWFVEGNGFGAQHLRDMTVRWVNLGKLAPHSPARAVAGQERPAGLFRVCGACGQLETPRQGNAPPPHRPWCRYRKAAAGNPLTIALTRTLRTEGLVLRLPRSVGLGDAFAVASMSAAVLLGLRERLGGDPDHLQISSIVDPTLSDGGDNEDALLLHDVIPGGTGYLAELADPDTLWSILHRSWEVLRDCPCQHEQRLACHRCLLPFAPAHQVSSVSRAAAERHLRALLGGDSEDPAAEMTWVCTEVAPEAELESNLEQRFRAVLTDRLTAIGATVKDTPTSSGNRSRITIGGSGRVWTLEPQQYVTGSRPDFLLRCDQSGIPEIAIFTDGWQWHASPAHNRLADDATKRSALRESGRLVIAVTHQDLDAAVSGTVEPPSWYSNETAAEIIQEAGTQLTTEALSLVTGGPIDLLLAWIQRPDPEQWQSLATWLPMFLLSPDNGGGAPAPGTAVTAVGVLDGDAPDLTGAGLGWVWRSGTLALVGGVHDENIHTSDVSLVLDDRIDDAEHKASWREWLRLSNLLNLRVPPTLISTRSLALSSSSAPVTAPADTPLLTGRWQELYDGALAVERDLIVQLAAADATVPEQGHETEDGIPVGLSWPDRRLAVDTGLEAVDRTDLDAAGWTVLAPDIDVVLAALTPGRS